jgi:hypothetical protein
VVGEGRMAEIEKLNQQDEDKIIKKSQRARTTKSVLFRMNNVFLFIFEKFVFWQLKFGL